ncbi:MAG: hypothetical protein [Circular genetic element sp.]|nr:MAG: hypothetical protein [Circular genetic element sp.]
MKGSPERGLGITDIKLTSFSKVCLLLLQHPFEFDLSLIGRSYFLVLSSLVPMPSISFCLGPFVSSISCEFQFQRLPPILQQG